MGLHRKGHCRHALASKACSWDAGGALLGMEKASTVGEWIGSW